ncbi:anti-sigma factor [Paraburkholderia diazotrophica]|uniref:anti-sigma factor family protein n=1 Tax=Paraburkholderia diazotrophica TaxID=667676 RepID=UPI00317EC431
MNNDEHSTGSTGTPDLRALSAFVDNELPESERAAVHAHLAKDPQAAAQVASWRAQKAALQALCGAGDSEREEPPVIVLRARVPWWRRVGIAACWLIAGAGLALALGPLVPHLTGSGNGDIMSFARRADIAYAVYTPERRHPVEVAASEEEHLITWLSKRLNRHLSVPSLQEYGYTLVGGRLLPGEAGPAAQFMYENQSGARLTLYVTGIPRDETAFRLFRDGNRRTFYWINDHMGYALSGPIEEAKLRSIAIEVCGELGGRPEAWQ